MRKTARVALVALVAIAAAEASSCSSESNPAQESSIPVDAYGRASDPLPASAQVVAWDEFERRVKTGELAPFTSADRHARVEAAARQEALDDALVTRAIAAKPELGRVIPPDPPASDTTTTTLPDGNFRHTIALKGGKTADVVTMGRAWSKHALAQSLRLVPRRSSRVSVYRGLYAQIPPTYRTRWGLTDPTRFDSAVEKWSADAVFGETKKILEHASEIAGLVQVDPNAPAGWVSDCTKEVGVANGSDRVGSSDTDVACKPQATGILKNYLFPAKYYVTCVKDQANRGTCTGFGITSAIETAVAMKHGVWANLSEQALYNRAAFAWAPRDYGDGLCAIDGMQGMANEDWLLYFENQWPYNPSLKREADDEKKTYLHSCDDYSDACSDSPHQSAIVCTTQGAYQYCAFYVPEKNPTYAGYRINGGSQFWDPNDKASSFALLKAFLYFGIPVVIGHPITESWDGAWQTGFMSYPGANQTQRGGHGIHAVGVIDNAKLAEILPNAPLGAGGGYVLVKNSWSNCWGDAGYIYVAWQSILDWTPDATVLLGVQ